MTAPSVRSVLVAVDFSEASAAAVPVAAELAEALGARLHAIHVAHIDVPPYFTPSQMAALEAEHARALENAKGFLAEYLRTHGAAGEVGLEVREGRPADVLVQTADHDLVVLGTHGRRGARRWWLGSVAETVAEQARRPVLVVNPEVARPLRGRGPVSLLAGPSPAPGAPVRGWATLLADALGVQVAPVSPEAVDYACLAQSTVVVVERPTASRVERATGLFVRRCRVPVLFV